MALTKTQENDKIEVVNRWNIQIRNATVIKEDGVEISRTNHRRVLNPSDCSYDIETKKYTHTDTDISGESEEIQKICNAVWTDELKADFRKELEKFCGPGAPGASN